MVRDAPEPLALGERAAVGVDVEQEATVETEEGGLEAGGNVDPATPLLAASVAVGAVVDVGDGHLRATIARAHKIDPAVC